MTVNFDEIVNRKNTNCLKYDFGMERKNRDDLLPLWVADMDFPLPNIILNDIEKTVKHGIFGYSEVKKDYFIALYEWFKNNFNWITKESWLQKTPGVVFAIAMSIKAFTKPNDSVMIQQPVYYPFSAIITDNNRKLVNNQLVYKDGKYSIDFEDFENKIINEKVKLFLLCSPHNPVGRVWTKDELICIGNICIKHKVLIVSDEIHCDFTYEGHKHTVFASINEDFAMNSIICTAPSKSFNIAGLQVSNIFIPNENLHALFKDKIYSCGYSQLNTIGLIACKSAYANGYTWLNDLKKYIKYNLDFTREYLKKHIPKIKLIEPEGTYLVWLDCSELNLSDTQLEELITDKAKLWLDNGIMFSKDTSQFQRINIACPKSILEKALNNLLMAVDSL